MIIMPFILQGVYVDGALNHLWSRPVIGVHTDIGVGHKRANITENVRGRMNRELN